MTSTGVKASADYIDARAASARTYRLKYSIRIRAHYAARSRLTISSTVFLLMPSR
jgi:hypothetical protein